MDTRDNNLRSFEELEVWQKCRDLRLKIRKQTNSFPKYEIYRLTDQIVRASRSVTANIAEGYGRFHNQENIQFCRIARGSLYELIDHFIVALDEGYINEQKLNELKNDIERCNRLLNGYINYLKRAKFEDRVQEETVPYMADNDYDETDNQ